MGTIKLEGDPPFDVVAQSAAAEAMGNTVEVTFQISNPGAQPSLVSLKVRLTPDVARSVGTQMTVHAGVGEEMVRATPSGQPGRRSSSARMRRPRQCRAAIPLRSCPSSSHVSSSTLISDGGATPRLDGEQIDCNILRHIRIIPNIGTVAHVGAQAQMGDAQRRGQGSLDRRLHRSGRRRVTSRPSSARRTPTLTPSRSASTCAPAPIRRERSRSPWPRRPRTGSPTLSWRGANAPTVGQYRQHAKHITDRIGNVKLASLTTPRSMPSATTCWRPCRGAMARKVLV